MQVTLFLMLYNLYIVVGMVWFGFFGLVWFGFGSVSVWNRTENHGFSWNRTKPKYLNRTEPWFQNFFMTKFKTELFAAKTYFTYLCSTVTYCNYTIINKTLKLTY